MAEEKKVQVKNQSRREDKPISEGLIKESMENTPHVMKMIVENLKKKE